MKLLLDEAKLDRFVARWRSSLMVGGVLLSLSFHLPKGWGFALTGFTVLSQGIYAFALRRWRTEPGLWMLALFLTLSLGGSWTYFECLSWGNLFNRAAGNLTGPRMTWQQVGFAMDYSLALLLFRRVVALAASVTVANWFLTRPHSGKTGSPLSTG